jgi:hypothetical protein
MSTSTSGIAGSNIAPGLDKPGYFSISGFYQFFGNSGKPVSAAWKTRKVSQKPEVVPAQVAG